MSKAVDWFRSRSQRNKGDNEKSKNSSFRVGGAGKSERRPSADLRSEPDSDHSGSSELGNPFRGRLPPHAELESHSHEIVKQPGAADEDWMTRRTRNYTSEDYGQQPQARDGYNRVRQDRASRSYEQGREGVDYGARQQHAWSNPSFSDSGMSSTPGRYPFPDSHGSRSSTSTDGNSFEEYPLQRRSMGQEREIDRRQSRSHAYEADPQQTPLHRLKEIDVATANFDYVLQNWPKLKSSYSDKRKFESRILTLIEVEPEVVVLGQIPTKERWSLGLVDDGMKALGRAIAARGYPKLKKLSFTRCRILLESPFATLARAINTSNLPNLEEICFQQTSYINNQGIIELAKAFKTGGRFSRLTTLILVDNGMQDEGLIALSRDAFGSGNLSNLKKLHIGSHNTSKENCEEFHLDAAREFAQELSSSGHLPELEDLRFSGCVHWNGVVLVIEALETRKEGALKSLDLSDSPLESQGMRVLGRAFGTPQFSSLLSLNLHVTLEEIPILLDAFQLSNLCALQRVVLSNVSLGEKELLGLAALLEGKFLPGLLEFSADCSERTVASALAFVRACLNNNSLVARLNMDLWPLEELQLEYEKHRSRNLELDALV